MPKAKKGKTKRSAATGRTTRAEATRQMYSRVPKLPNEIVDSILEILRIEGEFKTLTSVARASHTMYDIAIPKIYETVVFSWTIKKGKKRKNNHAMIAYGHSLCASHQDNQAQKHPTRKDIATSHTRKLVFQEVPDLPVSSSYRTVNEVELFAPSLMRPYEPGTLDQEMGRISWMEGQLDKCLKTITSAESSGDSVHVKVYTNSLYEDDVCGLLRQFESALPCTFEFFNLRVGPDLFGQYPAEDPLYMSYELQAVLHLEHEGACRIGPAVRVLAGSIEECFKDEDVEAPVGQLYLCGLPGLILKTEEVASALDIEEAALIKLFNHITVWPNLSGSQYKTKLDFFKSRIKLVGRGFRPSVADLYPRPQPTRGLWHMLVDETTILPDDEWSLTDEDPIESESEYCESEISCSDTGSGDGDMEDGLE